MKVGVDCVDTCSIDLVMEVVPVSGVIDLGVSVFVSVSLASVQMLWHLQVNCVSSVVVNLSVLWCLWWWWVVMFSYQDVCGEILAWQARLVLLPVFWRVVVAVFGVSVLSVAVCV